MFLNEGAFQNDELKKFAKELKLPLQAEIKFETQGERYEKI